MRSPAISLLSAAILCVIAGSLRLSAASDTTTKTIEARARVASRSSLAVSSERLQFVSSDASQPALATIEFVAGVRTHSGAEVVLTIEVAGALSRPVAADGDAVISFAGEGEGASAGSLSRDSSAVAGRWVGSGRRSGRISFALSPRAVGTYTVPIRFVLSAP